MIARKMLQIHVRGPVEATESGELMTQLTVQLDAIHFPEPRWTDRTEILLTWRAALDDPHKRVLAFRDGPYELHLEDYVDDPDLALLSFVVRTVTGPRIEATGVVSRSQFRAAVAEACGRVASLLREAGYGREAERFGE